MTTLWVPCGRYFGEGLAAPIEIIEEGPPPVIECPIRNRRVFLTPEERVRQALIWFLLKRARNTEKWRNYIRLEVEQRSLDIGLYLRINPQDDRFQFRVPILVGETKRLERDIVVDPAAEMQTKSYMQRERCRNGVIFNSRQSVWLSVADDFGESRWKRVAISELENLEARLNSAVLEAKSLIAEYEDVSSRAARGDFESLRHLVVLLRGDAWVTLTLSIIQRNALSAVRAFSVQAPDSETITYRTRGVVSRNRQRLDRKEFHSLVGVSE